MRLTRGSSIDVGIILDWCAWQVSAEERLLCMGMHGCAWVLCTWMTCTVGLMRLGRYMYMHVHMHMYMHMYMYMPMYMYMHLHGGTHAAGQVVAPSCKAKAQSTPSAISKAARGDVVPACACMHMRVCACVCMCMRVRLRAAELRAQGSGCGARVRVKGEDEG